jgi:hypothetical protein
MSAADTYGADAAHGRRPNGMTGIDVRHFADEQDASDDEWDETEENARLSEPLCSRVQRCRAFPFCCVDRVPFVLASVLLIAVRAMFCLFGSHLRRFLFSSMRFNIFESAYFVLRMMADSALISIAPAAFVSPLN